MNSKLLKWIAVGAIIAQAGPAFAANDNQVFYRYGGAFLANSRGTQVFTDTNGASNKNDETSGWAIGAGLDLAMKKDVGPGDLMGEIMLEYASFSRKFVRQTTSALLSGTTNSNIRVSELMVVVAPKYRLTGFFDGKLKPWIIPGGLSFMVNSPPSNDSGYLDVGYHTGLGLEFAVISDISIGADFRYTFAASQPNLRMSYGTAALYAGINF